MVTNGNVGSLMIILARHDNIFSLFRMYAPPDLPSLLLKYGEQIILGLNYLTEKGFVHRYLTAKHILVTDQNVCKVCHNTLLSHFWS